MDKILNNSDPTVAVIGGGTWATAIVKLLINNKKKVFWYMRNTDAISYIKTHHHHLTYLTAVYLDASVFRISDDINEVVSQSDILIFAVPSAYFIAEESKIKCGYENKMIISAIKGFVSKENLTIAEYFNQIYNIPFSKIAIISGPCHAEEVSMERLSYITISSKHIEMSNYLCKLFKNEYVNTIAGTDIYGVEYSAALKNVYAVAAGICHGLGYGDNFMAVLITSAYNELIEFLTATHPDPNRVTSRSAYMGDLLVTCYSQFSRNRTFGGMLGKGYSVSAAQIEMKQVAEGYFAAKAIYAINKKYQINMPIASAVYSILYEGKHPYYVIRQLCDVLL